MHTFRIFLLRMGWIGESAGVVCEPIPGVSSRLKCRGQVTADIRTVTYEVELKEIGYRPEPYAIADALMYADGKPIVEMTDMSIQISGWSKEDITHVWEKINSPPSQGGAGGGSKPTETMPPALQSAAFVHENQESARSSKADSQKDDSDINTGSPLTLSLSPKGRGDLNTSDPLTQSFSPRQLACRSDRQGRGDSDFADEHSPTARREGLSASNRHGEPKGRGNLKPSYDWRPVVYTDEQILAFAVGKPSEAFGDRYQVFDSERTIARLPGPPYKFLDRITRVTSEPWRMVAGGEADAQYDVPPDAWYFAAERQPVMPFSVLLEVALQPCGWLAAYVGSALTSATDLSFRNLGGSAVLHEVVTPMTGTLTTSVKMTNVSTSGGMIIQNYDLHVECEGRPIYTGDTYFGFFSKAALADQMVFATQSDMSRPRTS